ncbi:hypothetical protein [Legionella saoudiensis]|uniref:hypothetical protein n=1 Tax=Legionella saoudiensis TaxID=1750561 RepID=UPI000730AAEA|nr:hypothetical protein [Legionella saoudiensis]
MTNTNANKYKFFTEINTVQNLLHDFFNKLKKNNQSPIELANILQALLDGENIPNLPKELEPITIFLNKPELIIANLNDEGKTYFNAAVRDKLTCFITSLREQQEQEPQGSLEGPAGRNAFRS